MIVLVLSWICSRFICCFKDLNGLIEIFSLSPKWKAHIRYYPYCFFFLCIFYFRYIPKYEATYLLYIIFLLETQLKTSLEERKIWPHCFKKITWKSMLYEKVVVLMCIFTDHCIVAVFLWAYRSPRRQTLFGWSSWHGAGDYWASTNLPLLALYRVEHAVFSETFGFCS